MKRPEERQTPGRKPLYADPVRSTFIIPAAVLQAVEDARNIPGSNRNQKVVNALAMAAGVCLPRVD